MKNPQAPSSKRHPWRSWALSLSVLLNLVLVAVPLWWSSGRGGVGFLLQKLKLVEATVPEPYSERRKLYASLPATKADIMFLGDSITALTPWQELLPDRRVVNRGIHNDFALRLIGRIDALLRYEPDQLFLMIGINDLVDERPVDTVQQDIATVLETLQAKLPSTKVFLQSILPINARDYPRLESVPGKIVQLNGRLSAIAIEHGVTYLDLHSDFVQPDGLQVKDGLLYDWGHLSAEGTLLWSQKIQRHLTVTSVAP